MSRCSICAGRGHDKRTCTKKNVISRTKFYKKFVAVKKKFFKNENNIQNLRSIYIKTSSHYQLPEWMLVRANIINRIEYEYYKNEYTNFLKKKYDLCTETKYLVRLIEVFQVLTSKIENNILTFIFEFLYQPKKQINYYQRNKYLMNEMKERGLAF